jgi:NADH:ubiquinone oxidoreductase subunit F (NADH-binding)/(2Fe-2S) ferredoxin
MNLKQLETIKQQSQKRFDSYKASLHVCTGTACVANHSFSLIETLKKELKKRDLEKEILIVPTGCNGFCEQGPIMVVQPDGIFYQKLNEKDIVDIIEQHLINGKPVKRLFYKHPTKKTPIEQMKDIPFFGKQQLLAMRHRGQIDPEQINDYIRMGGYQTAYNVLSKKKAEEVIQTVTKSGIRGRGGGGFPTGLKWNSCRDAVKKTGNIPYVICNADEGDPGCFADRSIIEADPHSVIEGLIIGAYAIGAHEGFVYIRKEYPLALKRLQKAIQQAREQNILGKNILETNFDFDITIHRGAGAFVCGESTALMASLEGKPGEPHAKYVHSTEQGYKNMPTVLNNVETWANVPLILQKGSDWFANIGTGNVTDNAWGGSTGTKVFSLVGDVRNTGLVEVPMGITLREIIYDIGGGIPKDKKFKGVQTGGPSGGVLPESKLDLPVDFDSLSDAGSMMGSGGMVVMDEDTCMVQLAKYFIDFLKEESCGKCTPCREGLTAMSEILAKISEGKGTDEDIALLEEYGETMKVASLCGLGQTAANPVLSTITYFRDEYEAHIKDKTCPAGQCKPLVTFAINPEKCTGCTLCARNCPTNCITGEAKQVHRINQDECIKCGTCKTVCNFDAVEVN